MSASSIPSPIDQRPAHKNLKSYSVIIHLRPDNKERTRFFSAMTSLPTAPFDEHRDRESTKQFALRQAIREIRNDPDLTEEAKRFKMQALMNNGSSSKDKEAPHSGDRKLIRGSSRSTSPSNEAMPSMKLCGECNPQDQRSNKSQISLGSKSPSRRSSQDSSVIMEANQCGHYEKTCSRFFFTCCNTYDCCHRCHSDRMGCEIRPPQVASICCDFCDTRQAPGSQCVNTACPAGQPGASFSKHYCSSCLVWTQSEIAHCDKCGTCRVGSADDMYHCDTCDACFLNCHKERHRCLKSPLKGHDCPLCLESIHYSQKRCDILNCGHIAHYDCLVSYLAHQDRSSGGPVVPNCPTCRKSLLSREAAQPYWEALRMTIRLNPMPADWFGPVTRGDILMTQSDGPISVNEVIASTSTVSGIHLFTGMAATCKMSELSKVVEVDIMCNDCELKGRSIFHVFGLECRNCRGYNTARI